MKRRANKVWLNALASGCFVCAAVLGGCGEDSEPEALLPPRIESDQVTPPAGGVVQVAGPESCSRMDFSAGRVTDENVDDTLQVRWLVDWQGLDSSEGRVRDSILASTGEAARTDPVALTYSLALDAFDLDPESPHTMTVVVADRVMVNDAAVRFPDTEEGREGQYDLFQWTFVLADGGLCTEVKP